VALQVKPAFKPLFRAWLENEETQRVTLRFASDITIGDPEGERGRQKLTTPRWGGLRLAKVASPLSLVRFRPLAAKKMSVSDSQLPLFDLS